MSETTMTPPEFDLGPGLRLEAQIAGSDVEGIQVRWEFGRWLLAQRVGKKLPVGLLDQLVAATGQSRTELQYRVRFAERYPDEEALCNALHNHSSWHAVVTDALATSAAKAQTPAPVGAPRKCWCPSCVDAEKLPWHELDAALDSGEPVPPISWEFALGFAKWRARHPRVGRDCGSAAEPCGCAACVAAEKLPWDEFYRSIREALKAAAPAPRGPNPQTFGGSAG
jgi:hypothetical protein